MIISTIIPNYSASLILGTKLNHNHPSDHVAAEVESKYAEHARLQPLRRRKSLERITFGKSCCVHAFYVKAFVFV